MSERTMACAYCGQKRAWPDGFPSTTYARCWPCAWEDHRAVYHPKRWWRLWGRL